MTEIVRSAAPRCTGSARRGPGASSRTSCCQGWSASRSASGRPATARRRRRRPAPGAGRPRGGEIRDWLVEKPAGLRRHRQRAGAPVDSGLRVDERSSPGRTTRRLRWLADIRDDPHHRPGRPRRLVVRLAADPQHDPRCRPAPRRSRPGCSATAGRRHGASLWRSVRASLLSAMDDEDSGLYPKDGRLARRGGEHLVADPALRARLESDLGDALRLHGDDLWRRVRDRHLAHHRPVGRPRNSNASSASDGTCSSSDQWHGRRSPSPGWSSMRWVTWCAEPSSAGRATSGGYRSPSSGPPRRATTASYRGPP